MIGHWSKLVLGAAISALVVTACGGASSPASGGSASKEPVVIGGLDDLTGAASSIGIPDKQAMELAVGNLNKSGGANGHPLKLVFYDTKSDPALTATLAQRLVTQDHAVAITCCASSTTVAAAAQVAGQLKVPVLSSGVVQALTADDRPWKGYVFRVSLDNNSLAKFNVDFIKSKGWKKIALDTSSLTYGTDSIPFFKSYIPQSGGTIVAQTSQAADTTDSSVVAAQLLQSKPDVVLVWDYPAPLAQLVKAIRATGSQVPIVSTWSALLPIMSTVAGKDIPNLYGHDQVDTSKPSVIAFQKQYQSTYNAPLQITYQNMVGYIHTEVIFAAIKNAKSVDSEGIRAALQDLNCVKTLIGLAKACITYGPGNYEGAHHDTENFLIMKVMKNGEWVPA